MVKRTKQATVPGGPRMENRVASSRGELSGEDPCRCKQVSVMSPRQLLGTMLNDLAFWKKAKKG